MLRRLLVRRYRDDPTELVLLAHSMIDAIIDGRNVRGTLQTTVDVAWTLVLYGLPAAGVLALELLQLNVQAVPHAKIKQNLCVFVSHLKWAHVPGEGNYMLALRGWETLQRILDKVFASEASAPQRLSDLSWNGHEDSLGDLDDLSMFDFSWFDQGQFEQILWDGSNSI
jgi:hypothetical protein